MAGEGYIGYGCFVIIMYFEKIALKDLFFSCVNRPPVKSYDQIPYTSDARKYLVHQTQIVRDYIYPIKVLWRTVSKQV